MKTIAGLLLSIAAYGQDLPHAISSTAVGMECITNPNCRATTQEAHVIPVSVILESLYAEVPLGEADTIALSLNQKFWKFPIAPSIMRWGHRWTPSLGYHFHKTNVEMNVVVGRKASMFGINFWFGK